MTDLNTLRRALQVPDEAADPLDISAIIGRGRRLRRRRRLVAIAGGVCAAAAVFGAVTGITRLAATPVAPAGPARSTLAPSHSHGVTRPPSRATTPLPTPSVSPSGTAPNPSASPTFAGSGPSPTFPAGGPSATFPGGLPTPSPSGSDQPSSTPASPASISPSPSRTG